MESQGPALHPCGVEGPEGRKNLGHGASRGNGFGLESFRAPEGRKDQRHRWRQVII